MSAIKKAKANVDDWEIINSALHRIAQRKGGKQADDIWPGAWHKYNDALNEYHAAVGKATLENKRQI